LTCLLDVKKQATNIK